jgi:curved DNA-binding protein CbpA
LTVLPRAAYGLDEQTGAAHISTPPDREERTLDLASVDYYAILGVDERASPEQIRSGYRRAARAHHPDQNPGDPDAAQRFRRVQTAYDVLKDPARRAAYRRPRSARWPSARAPESAAHLERSTAAELGEVLAILTVAATIRLERRLRQITRYLEQI